MYYNKYLKYKNKYLKLQHKYQVGGKTTEDIRSEIEGFYKQIFKVEPDIFPLEIKSQLFEINDIITKIISLANMQDQQLYDFKSNELVSITRDMIIKNISIINLDIKLDIKENIDIYSKKYLSYEIYIYSESKSELSDQICQIRIPLFTTIYENAYAILKNEKSINLKLSETLGYKYLDSKNHNPIDQNTHISLNFLGIEKLYIRNCKFPIVSLLQTVTGRLGNNLTALLSFFTAYSLCIKTGHNFGYLLGLNGNLIKSEADFFKIHEYIFVTANSWNHNSYDPDSKTYDKFGVARQDGLYAILPYLSNTYYANYSYRIFHFGYSMFLFNTTDTNISRFIKNVLHPLIKQDSISVKYSLKITDIVVHLHLRHSDYCYAHQQFYLVHFKYYHECINQIIKQNKIENIKLIIFCPMEDRMVAELLKLYLSDLLSPEQILYDDQCYNGLNGLNINYIMSNYCNYLILSNSTFSLLSLAFVKLNNIYCFSPTIENDYSKYGCLHEEMQPIIINGKSINYALIKTPAFSCKINNINFINLLYNFVKKNNYSIDKEYFNNLRKFIESRKWHLILDDIKIIDKIPTCNSSSCIKDFINSLELSDIHDIEDFLYDNDNEDFPDLDFED